MTDKPKWPYSRETTLTANPNGQWSKKFRGKVYYFGVWADPPAALQNWRDRWPTIVAGGEAARHATGGTGVKDATQEYLLERHAHHTAGDIEWSTYRELKAAGDMISLTLGNRPLRSLTPADFSKLMEQVGHRSAIARSNFAGVVKRIFEWVGETYHVDFEYGTALKRPPLKSIRRQRNKRKNKVATPADIHTLLGVANPRARAILLLGINGGYGNKDLAMIETKDVDLKAGVIDHYRSKTEARRIVPLWPETVKALRAIPHGDPLLFPDPNGLPIVRRGTHGVCRIMGELRKATGLSLTYYAMRYTFATVAAETGDDHARRLIMGHVIDGVSENYVLNFPQARLVKVTDHVRGWLFSKASG